MSYHLVILSKLSFLKSQKRSVPYFFIIQENELKINIYNNFSQLFGIYFIEFTGYFKKTKETYFYSVSVDIRKPKLNYP